MKDSTNKNKMFSLIHLLSGIIGIALTGSWLLFSTDKQALAVAILCIFAFLSIIIIAGGFVTLNQVQTLASFSPAVRRYHLYVIIAGVVVWLVLMPALLGLGAGQLFFVLSGFSLYVLPSMALFILNRFIEPTKELNKPWRQWMEEKALEKSLKK